MKVLKRYPVSLAILALFMLAGNSGVAQIKGYTPSANSAVQTDTRVRQYLTPQRIVWQQNDEGALIKGADNLLKPGGGQSVLGLNDVCLLKSAPDKTAAILLDFGSEIHGGLQIVTSQYSGKTPATIRVRFGESVSEAMSDIDDEGGATNDHAMRDFTMKLPWLGVIEVGNTGFRFVRIDVLDSNAQIGIKEVRAISVFQDIPYVGSFKCNDERLNKIWQVGAKTVHLNMQGYLWDGIKRDRLVWVGDLHPEVMTVSTVFGYNEVVPRSLDLARDTNKIPKWMNGLSSYSLWWILIHRDWYFYHGDLDYLKQQRGYMTDLLAHLLTKIDAKGKETLDARFLDWPSSPNTQGIGAGLQSMMIMTFDAGAELCDILGEKSLAGKCRDAAKRMRKYVPDHNGLKQAVALMSIAGVMPADKADKLVSKNGAEGFSTFYGYYMLEAQAKAGNYQGALDCIRTYWGGMLDLGATTFWEDFDLKWLDKGARIDEITPEGKIDVHRTYDDYCYKGFRHSLCHGWASGPTSWLSEHILGVQVVEPGCRTVRVTPNLGDLTWAEGTFPTPYGVIEIRHEKQSDGSVKSTVKAPNGVKIIR